MFFIRNLISYNSHLLLFTIKCKFFSILATVLSFLQQYLVTTFFIVSNNSTNSFFCAYTIVFKPNVIIRSNFLIHRCKFIVGNLIPSNSKKSKIFFRRKILCIITASKSSIFLNCSINLKPNYEEE